MGKIAAEFAVLKKKYAEFLGPHDILTPESGRPYIKVATKGDAILLMNVDFGKACHHPPPAEGEQQKHIPAFGVVVRFFQRGGNKDSFQPPLSIRAEGENVYRLSKHTFPLCVPFINPSESWAKQDVGNQLMVWLKGICDFCGATPVNDSLLFDVINLGSDRYLGQEYEQQTQFFSLDATEVEHSEETQESSEPEVLFDAEAKV